MKMTRSRILKIKFCAFLSIFFLVQIATCNANHRVKRDNETRPAGQSDQNSSNDVHTKQNLPEVPVAVEKTPDEKSHSDNLTSNGSGKQPAKDIVQNTSEKVNTVVNVEGNLAALNTGAIKRGFYVLIGLSILVIAYFVFRSFRVTKKRAQMIRKYGILAHRQDVEMRPLPLDEDDEDDTTVFDASNISAHNTLQTSP